MSTRIDDLPGSIPEDIINDIHTIENNFRHNQEDEIVKENTIKNKHIPSEDLDLHKTNSNISLNIKKKVKFEDGVEDKNFFTFIKDEINEENLLLFVILILSSRNDLDPFIKIIPFIKSYVSEQQSLSLILIRCFILLVIYLVLRQYVIPKIKL